MVTCRCLPLLLRVASSVQQIYLLISPPPWLRMFSFYIIDIHINSSLSNLLASFAIMFHFRIYFRLIVFFCSYFSGVACVVQCCVFVPGTLTFHSLYPWIRDNFVFGIPVSQNSLWHQNQQISRIRNQDGHWVYRWSGVERTIESGDKTHTNSVRSIK